jgi:hypothetical protein
MTASMKTKLPRVLLIIISFISAIPFITHAQPVTGVWKGKIGSSKVEIKLVQKGDSITGTSYYYESENNFRRYSIKGYFDLSTGSIIWWDDQVMESISSASKFSGGSSPLLAEADFNCPGEGIMLLDGKANPKNDDGKERQLHLKKDDSPLFPDEWDFVIDNYTTGANDPFFIDSIGQTASVVTPGKKMVAIPPPPPVIEKPREETKPSIPEEKPFVSTPANTPEEKFSNRKKVKQTEIPITGNTIELHFYDNAQIDGDSIALFLNNQLIFKHIRLTDKPYIVKLNAADLQDDNEVVMVAENLGSIPPNTSYMVAIVGKERYEARLYANENSSALVRLVKPAATALPKN